MLDDLVEYLSRKVPEGPSTPEMLEMFSFDLGKDALETPVKLMQKYGDVIKLPQGEAYLVANPNFVKHIYKVNPNNFPRATQTWEAMKTFFGEASLTTNGEHWQNQRNMIQPGFQANRIKNYVSQMVEILQQEIPKFKAMTKTDKKINLIYEMGKLNTKIIHKCLFNYLLSDNEASIITESINKANLEFSSYINLPTFLISKNKKSKMEKQMQYIQEHAENLYNYAKNNNSGSLLNDIVNKSSSNKLAVDEIKTLIITGEETAATGMSFLIYLLNQNPQFLPQVNAEIDMLNADNINFESLMSLKFTTGAILEALRMYPPIWATQRRATQADECAGYYVPKNKIINIHIYAMHRNPNYWLEPERFYPARFVVPELLRQGKKAFFPFLVGSQTCPAKNFALTEMKIITAMLLKKFKFKFDKSFKPKFRPSIALQTKDGILAKIEER